jgi:Family of unknown function (DUF5825)
VPSGDRGSTGSAAVLEFDQPESSLNVSIAGAVQRGVRAVRVAGTWCLSTAAPRASLALVRLLREAASDGVPINWEGWIGEGVDGDLLVHLPPPVSMPGQDGEAGLARWRERYQPGLCYYRIGPEFVLVKDVRRPGASARYRLEGVVDAFRTLEAVVEVASLDAVTRGVLDDLDREGLLLRLGGLATLLPYRMRRWPVPAHEV